MIVALKRFIKKIIGRNPSNISYWRNRAQSLGERSVINQKYSLSVDEITDYQVKQIFPFLRNELKGDEKIILDFGCGTGRFTGKLAAVINGHAIGVDPIPELLEIAREKNPGSAFLLSKKTHIPLSDKHADVAWVCLVMGGIPSNEARKVALEIHRVVRNDGLLVLVENTSSLQNTSYWNYRSPEQYAELFREFDLKPAGSYKEVDENITILTGRKK